MVHSRQTDKLMLFSQLGRLDYSVALRLQRVIHELRETGRIADIVLLLEHPPTFTLGKNAGRENILLREDELLKRSIAVHRTDRGGDVTGHNPGQLVGYPILDLTNHFQNVPRYIYELEESIIRTLSDFRITAIRHAVHRGVWVENAKIASIGVRISRWITMHGLALNVSNDLAFFEGINPCGIAGCRMTSMERLSGRLISIDEVARCLMTHVAACFEVTIREVPASEIIHELE
jgi:lipoate-protein ligase B